MEKNRVYPITHSITHPAYFMPLRTEALALWNMTSTKHKAQSPLVRLVADLLHNKSTIIHNKAKRVATLSLKLSFGPPNIYVLVIINVKPETHHPPARLSVALQASTLDSSRSH